MRIERLFLVWLAVFAWGCDGASDPAMEQADEVVELGALDGKADGVVLREVPVEVQPGATKYFRIRTTGFRASLDQSTDQPVQLSAKHYDIDIKGDVERSPNLEATADSSSRNWTLRVANRGDGVMKGNLLVTEWTPIESEPPFVGVLGDELRRVDVDVAAGDVKTFRIKTTRFHAGLTQDGEVPALLSVKHYEIELEGELSASPTVQAIADVDKVRNWTLRVENHGDSALVGTLLVHALIAERTTEIGIISDIDKTIMPPKVDGELVAPYPGIVEILTALEFRDSGEAGDLEFVTARNTERIIEVPAYFAEYDVPEGPISTGISGVPWIAQAEKFRDISAILDANPDQRFVMFGDASHRDPEAYREIINAYPGRIVAAYIHRVKNINDERAEQLNVFDHYGEVAASLYGLGLLNDDEVETVMKAVSDGTDVTEAELDALLDAQRE